MERDPHDSIEIPPESTLWCREGGDHSWPAELDDDARCSECGLEYDQWIE